MNQGWLLLVDDDPQVLRSISEWLKTLGYQLDTASSCTQAWTALKHKDYDVVLADIHLSDGNGFDLLSYCQQQHPTTSVILMTGDCTVDSAVDALRAGAFDFLAKPLTTEELGMAVQRAMGQRRVLEENQQLKAQLDMRFGLEHIVGHDPRMLRVYDMISSVADTKATVLITGESGTGKSLIARAIHRASSRRAKPFVEVACGALSETLLESELFGHVAGAFTGAVCERIGKFMQANEGTIFLDEISTASPAMQVKLLRILQDFEFEQVGGIRTFLVDTRVILATNEDLDRAVAENRFRHDLYYRVNVINIELPPLRERVSDIPLLARHFLDRITRDTGKPVHGFTEPAMAALRSYLWPGNVRELQNVIERAVLLGKRNVVGIEDFPPNLAMGNMAAVETNGAGSLKQALQSPERQIILDVLEANGWNRLATAEVLGINRTTLYKKMKRLGLHEPRRAVSR